jgi:hypothetical protein
MKERTTQEQVWYYARCTICIISFGMIFPNVLTERMDLEDTKRTELVDR